MDHPSQNMTTIGYYPVGTELSPTGRYASSRIPYICVYAATWWEPSSEPPRRGTPTVRSKPKWGRGSTMFFRSLDPDLIYCGHVF